MVPAWIGVGPVLLHDGQPPGGPSQWRREELVAAWGRDQMLFHRDSTVSAREPRQVASGGGAAAKRW